MSKNNIPYSIQKLENEPVVTTNNDNYYDISEIIDFRHTYDYLYHGIRFQKYLEKLEKIFKDKKILAGIHIDGYHFYSDNCNKGQYVSLLKWTNKNTMEYSVFIESNISLLVTPACDAIETKYVPYNTWEEIKNLKLKQIYSYMQGECMCKDYIPLEMVQAIGVPYQKLIDYGKYDYANKLLEDIQNLMQKYDITLSIVDTSRYNRVLVSSSKNKIKK